jgi:hypothetical protein
LGSVVTDLMNDLLYSARSRVQVRVDVQLLDFEWIPEESRWEAVEMNGNRVRLEARLMRKYDVDAYENNMRSYIMS